MAVKRREQPAKQKTLSIKTPLPNKANNMPTTAGFAVKFAVKTPPANDFQ
jgi:hypothetical protein